MMHAWSRRNEHRADRFALTMTERPEAFVSAMRRLAAQNLAEERPSTATLWLFHSHPPFDQRIQAARAFLSCTDFTEHTVDDKSPWPRRGLVGCLLPAPSPPSDPWPGIRG